MTKTIGNCQKLSKAFYYLLKLSGGCRKVASSKIYPLSARPSSSFYYIDKARVWTFEVTYGDPMYEMPSEVFLVCQKNQIRKNHLPRAAIFFSFRIHHERQCQRRWRRRRHLRRPLGPAEKLPQVLRRQRRLPDDRPPGEGVLRNYCTDRSEERRCSSSV